MTRSRIVNSVDWNKVQLQLHEKTFRLSYCDELNTMIDNIGSKVTKLSKTEVEARRGRANQAQELIEDINNDIEFVEEYIFIAILLGYS